MCTSELGQDNDHPQDLERVIAVQKEVTRRAKEAGLKKLFNVCICVDDFADNPAFSRQERLVWELFFRGRRARRSGARLPRPSAHSARPSSSFAFAASKSSRPLRKRCLPSSTRRP